MAIGRSRPQEPAPEPILTVRMWVTDEERLWQIMSLHADGTLVLEDARTGTWLTMSPDDDAAKKLRVVEPEGQR